MIATFESAWDTLRTEFHDLRAAPKEAELAVTAHRLAGSCAVLGLVVLDRRLPDSDGLLLIQSIRDSNNCPVIILSAMDDVRDKLLGIGLGAAEYVTKPFNPLELTSRIRQLLHTRAEPDADNDVFEIANLVFNPRSRQLDIGGQPAIYCTGGIEIASGPLGKRR